MEKRKQNISVMIAGKEFGLSIDPVNEERIRAAVARINGEIDALRFDYKEVDEAEILRIVLLSEEKRLVEKESRCESEKEALLDKVSDLDAALGEYLLSR